MSHVLMMLLWSLEYEVFTKLYMCVQHAANKLKYSVAEDEEY